MSSLSKYFKEEIDKIGIPHDELNILVKKTIKKANNKNKGFNLKLMTYTGVAVLLIGIFISSTFVSPAMAKVASKIPIINLIYHSDSQSLGMTIKNGLQDKGFQVGTIDIQFSPKRSITVTILGPVKNSDEIKDNVKGLVQSILKTKGYNAFSIHTTFKAYNSVYRKVTEQEKEQAKKSDDLIKKIESLNFPIRNVGIEMGTTNTSKKVTITVNEGVKNYNYIKNDIINAVKVLPEYKPFSDYKIVVTTYHPDPAEDFIPDLAEQLMGKKEYKVTGIGYKNNPPEIIISTSEIESEKDVKKYSQNLEEAIQKYLKSDKVSKILDGISYKIIIKSKDGTVIN